MAVTKLQAGGVIETLTPSDMAEQMDRVVDRLDALGKGPIILRRGGQVTTDGSGNLGGGVNGPGLELYRCPVGVFAVVSRLSITAPPGATGSPGFPLTTGWVAVYVSIPASDSLINFVPQGSSGVLPLAIEEGTSAVKITKGESIIVVGASLPVTTSYGWLVQVRMFPEERPPDVPVSEV